MMFSPSLRCHAALQLRFAAEENQPSLRDKAQECYKLQEHLEERATAAENKFSTDSNASWARWVERSPATAKAATITS